MKVGRPGNWTDEDHELIRSCIRADMTSRQVHEQYFSHRTAESIKRKMGILRAEMNMPAKTNFDSRNRYRAAPTQLYLAPLKYTLDECPRVTVEEAKEWMLKIKRHWVAPKDKREAWRQINGARLFGQVPVPPFLPRDGV